MSRLSLEAYWMERERVGFDEVSYGVGGIELFRSHASGSSRNEGPIGPASLLSPTEAVSGLAGQEWLAVGLDSACGDLIVLSMESPYPVVVLGSDSCDLRKVAPSLETFWRCLGLFKEFSRNREDPIQLSSHFPTDGEIAEYLVHVNELVAGDEESVEFWAIQAEIGI